jgi:flagellum-specific ATP synthase
MDFEQDIVADIRHQLGDVMTTSLTGTVVETVGMTATVADFPAPVGAQVSIARESGASAAGEVIGFRDQHTVLYLFTGSTGVRRGDAVRVERTTRTLRCGGALLGRVIDAHGHAIDGRPQPMLLGRVSLDREPPPPVERPRIRDLLSTGVHVIDAMLACGRGQRLGIFAGSGVGKSVMLGMMSRHTDAEVIVIGLIGERGREVNEFLERDLGAEGLARSVVVVATSNEPALTRVKAAFTATAVAEYFRDKGRNVLLLLDSVTRFAMAQREIGLAAGEPPTTRGYTPSVFAELPKLLERAGPGISVAPGERQGHITGLFTVLVDGDDHNEPISDAVRAILDGHITLSRHIAERGRFPAVDVLKSISRLQQILQTPREKELAVKARRLMALYSNMEELVRIGAYAKGADPEVDEAVRIWPQLETFLAQDVFEKSAPDEAFAKLEALLTPPAPAKPTPLKQGSR